MKKIVLVLMLCGFAHNAISQNASVEKSTLGLQTGILGIWLHSENRLSDQVALRSEIGLDAGILGGNLYYNGTGYLFIPVITLEPRWYYNLDKRVSRSKDIAGNGGNFLSLKTSFHPDWFVISNYSPFSIIDQILIMPTWGIKRNLGDHLTYEAGFGFGYRHVFAKSVGYSENEGDTAANVHLRIGYRF